MAHYFHVEHSPSGRIVAAAAAPLPTPPSFRAAVELGPFRARPLRAADRAAFLRLLEQLTTVGAVSEAAFSERLAQVERRDRAEHGVQQSVRGRALLRGGVCVQLRAQCVPHRVHSCAGWQPLLQVRVHGPHLEQPQAMPKR